MKLINNITASILTVVAFFSAFAFSGCGENATDSSENQANTLPDLPSIDNNTNEEDVIDEGDMNGEDIEIHPDYIAGDWNYYTYDYIDSTGAETSLAYGVYLPASYDGKTPLPLLTYIPDARYLHSKLTTIAKAEAPTAWLTDEKMEEHPAIWLIIQISVAQFNVSTTGSQAAQIVPIVDKVIEDFNINEDRLYLTGHSMGAMMSFVVNDAYPEKFAATYYVSCGMGITDEKELYDAITARAYFADQKFVFITSRGDENAPIGQDSILNLLLDMDVELGYCYDLDVTAENLEERVQTILSQGYDINFLSFLTTAIDTNQSEHVSSFAPSYAIDAIYEWLFAQSKDNGTT